MCMSTLIYGNIVCDYFYDITKLRIDYKLIQFCLENDFGIRFLNSSFNQKSKEVNILFQLADNFLSSNCEFFLEPIIYNLKGEPQIDDLTKDIEKVYGLIKIALSFSIVKKIELNFSYVEVDEEEYELCRVSLTELKQAILKKYLEYKGIPVVRFIINSDTEDG